MPVLFKFMPFNTRDRLESVCLHARQMYTLTCSVITVQSRYFKIYINMPEADLFVLLTGLYLRENMDGSKLLETSLCSFVLRKILTSCGVIVNHMFQVPP